MVVVAAFEIVEAFDFAINVIAVAVLDSCR